jgi:hypothetical protein
VQVRELIEIQQKAIRKAHDDANARLSKFYNAATPNKQYHEVQSFFYILLLLFSIVF